jgi:hypothetical protein
LIKWYQYYLKCNEKGDKIITKNKIIVKYDYNILLILKKLIWLDKKEIIVNNFFSWYTKCWQVHVSPYKIIKK